MPRDAVSRTANVGTVGTNGLKHIRYFFLFWDVHMDKSSVNLVNPNQIWITITVCQTEIRFVLNYLEK